MNFNNRENNQGSLLGIINELTDEIEEKLKTGDIQLPVLPVVATQVIGMTSSENTDLKELSDLIHQDQALAGHVLRIANSAFFAGGQSADTLEEAVGRLGMSMIGEMATITAIRGNVFNVPAFKEDVEQIWHHALLSGFYGKEIAKTLNHNSEIQFLCGLLHTIGKPILYQMVCYMGATHMFRDGSYYALRDLVKRLHKTAGEFAADSWNLPSRVKASCGYYNNRWDTKEHRLEVGMTLLSSRLAEWCQTKNSDLEKRLHQDSVLKELQLSSEKIDTFKGMNQQIGDLADAMKT